MCFILQIGSWSTLPQVSSSLNWHLMILEAVCCARKELQGQLIKVKVIIDIWRGLSFGRSVSREPRRKSSSTLGFVACSSHSGRRSFITQATRKAWLVGGLLRGVQALAGHASLSTTKLWSCFCSSSLG